MINHDETFRGTWAFKPNFFNEMVLNSTLLMKVQKMEILS